MPVGIAFTTQCGGSFFICRNGHLHLAEPLPARYFLQVPGLQQCEGGLLPVWLPHGGTICTFGCFHKTCGRQRGPCCCNVGKEEARAIWRFAWNKKRTGTRRAVPTKTLPGAECPCKRLRTVYGRTLEEIWQATFGTAPGKKRGRGSNCCTDENAVEREKPIANACKRHTAVPWKKPGKLHLGLRLTKRRRGVAMRRTDENAAGAECPRKRLRAAYSRASKEVS